VLLTVTANVAQVFLTDAAWAATLGAADAAPRWAPGLRDPSSVGEGWLEWNRERSYQRTVVSGVGAVQTWEDVLGFKGDQVFRSTVVFEADGAVLTSTSTLRFRQGV
jgi:hypothetical protein